ncbi:MAG: sigma-70 family RNA polymerase sigma factor [Spirochaetia bacterium]|nr:sigma-70 family RNA polymerase sigma factor [Spirochaetia bacterium]
MQSIVSFAAQLFKLLKMSEELSKLLGHHRQRVLGFFRKRIDIDIAEDLCQEVLLRIHRAWDKFDPSRGDFGAWSLAIARNVLYDYLKKANNSIQADELQEEISADKSNSREEKELREELLNAIARLPEPERTVVSNRELLGMRLADTATDLNLSVRTVSRKLLSAYDLLRADLIARGIHPGESHEP